MTFYLDASAILPTLVEEAASASVDVFLAGASGPLIISDFAATEVASALARLLRMGLLAERSARERLDTFDVWRATVGSNFELQPSDVRLAGILIRRFDLSLRAPDAIHIAACRRGDYTLITLDRRLASATQALDVRVMVPD